MKSRSFYRYSWVLSALLIVSIAAGCTGKAVNATTAPSAIPETSAPPVEATTTTPAASTPEPVADQNVIYQDNFTNPASGWPEEKFDNYFIGYHEPEFYHIEITSANYKTTVFEPTKQSLSDASIEVKAFTNSKKTSATGDFNYGPAFRRSGDNYYAFTISPRAKKWFLLKSTPSALVTLAEGTDDKINDLDTPDTLRVDAQGSNFSLYINDQQVGQATDADYASGAVGFYVQTVDATNVHVHFDALTIKKLAAVQVSDSGATTLYQDAFTNPASGWAEKKFDNYFIGYHEPEFYHIEITTPNYKTTVFEPTKKNFDNMTVEVQAFTNSKKTSATGDFSYGPAFRRSGDNYYAFTISPRTKKWFLLKSTPNALVTLAEGTDENIHDLDTADTLRVDADGSHFYLHINDELVGQATDADYATGEVGFYVQTVDATNVHVHFDSIAIKSYETPLVCNVKALALNVRSGPGTKYSSSVFLSKDDILAPVARTSNGEWLKIQLEGKNNQGWVFNSAEFISCTGALETLPVVTP
jgi:hypothetical protein